MQSIIRDNIRENSEVVGILADRLNAVWFDQRYKKYTAPAKNQKVEYTLPFLKPMGTEELVALPLDQDAGKIKFRYRENNTRCTHKLNFDKVDVSDVFIGAIGIVSEGRSVFCFRITDTSNSDKWIDVRFDSDFNGNYTSENEIGVLYVCLASTKNRHGRFTVFFRPKTSGSFDMSLITQNSLKNKSSIFKGMPAVGFALEEIELSDQILSLPTNYSNVGFFFNAPIAGPTFFQIRGRSKMVLAILHEGELGNESVLSFKVNKNLDLALIKKYNASSRTEWLQNNEMIQLGFTDLGLQYQDTIILEKSEFTGQTISISRGLYEEKLFHEINTILVSKECIPSNIKLLS